MLRRTVIALIVCTLGAATAQAAKVYGYCYLEGKTNHCCTKVEIDGSVLHPPAHTDPSGYYSWLAIGPGWHTFTYSHPGYHSETQEVEITLLPLVQQLPDVTLKTKAICNPTSWQHYPYTIPGTKITFSRDDGRHDPSTAPIEWWYVNFHLTDESGTEYGGIVSFFKPLTISPGMVLFSLIDLDTGKMHPPGGRAKYPLLCKMNDEWLELAFGAPPVDRWYNRECEGKLLPFEYYLDVSWLDGLGVAWLKLDMACLKRPMPVGGKGLVQFGTAGWSYYYSHPRVDVLGKLHLPGFPALGKHVHGYAWIDHQWANFVPGTVTWEWLSIQLDDLRDIMVADVWIDDKPQGSFSGGLNYYDESCSLDILPDYTMTPLASWTDPATGKEFATRWRVTEPKRKIDLTVIAAFDHQIIHVTQIFPACFWEGACTVSGTIGGQPVHGTAYGEVTHSPPVFCLGDSNCDAVRDFEDIDYFVAALSSEKSWRFLYARMHGGQQPPCDYLLNDCNGDGKVNFDDIDCFVENLGKPCP